MERRFCPYGYKLENGELKIAEDEADVIRAIYDQYLHTNTGVNGVAKYLNSHGYTKSFAKMDRFLPSPMYLCGLSWIIPSIWARSLMAAARLKRSWEPAMKCTS